MTIRPLIPALAFAVIISPLSIFAQAAAPATTATAPAPATPPAATAPATSAAADSTPVAPGDRPDSYTIAQGDSLWTVAHKYGTTVVALRKLNNLKKGALLHPGQVIKLPPAKSDAAAK